MKTAVVHSRIEPGIKRDAEKVLKRLGVTPTEAIRLFYTQVALHDGLPFPIRIPNETTKKALLESRAGENLEAFDHVDDLFKSWEA